MGGYRVQVGTVSIECDTAELALEVALKAQGMGKATVGPSVTTTSKGTVHPTSTRWTEAKANDFWKALKSDQQKIVNALFDAHADGRTDVQLRQLLGLNNNKALAGAISGLAKNAGRWGISPNEIYHKKIIPVGNGRVIEYSLNDNFRQLLSKIRKQ